MTKRKRSDSSAAAIGAFKNAIEGPPNPPAHVNLPDYARPFWDSIVSARARDKWNDSDYEMAANLARCKADIERLQAEIYEEGDVIENAKGTQIMNPKHNLLETLSRRAVALSRILHVHAEATVGKSQNQAQSDKVHKDAINAVASIADDDLIAKPTSH